MEERRRARKEKQAEFIRQQFIESAWKLIDQRGVGSLTMEDVAKEAGYATGSIYNYFSSKDDLLVRTLQWDMTQRKIELAQPIPEALTPLEKLDFLVTRMIDGAERNRAAYLAMYNYFPFLSESMHQEVQEWMDKILWSIVEDLSPTINQLVEAIAPTRMNGVQLAHSLMELTHGEVARGFIMPTSESVPQRARRVVRLILFGACGLPPAGLNLGGDL